MDSLLSQEFSLGEVAFVILGHHLVLPGTFNHSTVLHGESSVCSTQRYVLHRETARSKSNKTGARISRNYPLQVEGQ